MFICVLFLLSVLALVFFFFFVQNTKAEKEIQLKMVKCYLGLKKKLKPPCKWAVKFSLNSEVYKCLEMKNKNNSYLEFDLGGIVSSLLPFTC